MGLRLRWRSVTDISESFLCRILSAGPAIKLQRRFMLADGPGGSAKWYNDEDFMPQSESTAGY